MRLIGWIVLLAAAGCVERVPEIPPDLDAGPGVQDGSERPETTAPGSGSDREIGADSAGPIEPAPVADGAVAGDLAGSPDAAIAGPDGAIPDGAVWPPGPGPDAGPRCETASCCYHKPGTTPYASLCPRSYPYCCPWTDERQTCSTESCVPLSPPGCVYLTDAGAGAGYCTGTPDDECTAAGRICGSLIGGYGLVYDAAGRVIDLITRRGTAPPQELKACVLRVLEGQSFSCVSTVYLCREYLP